MKTYKKNYIGKGTQVPNMQIVKVTVKVAELLNFVYEYEGEDYCHFRDCKNAEAGQIWKGPHSILHYQRGN